MPGYLTNRRPVSSTDWGVGNSSFLTRFIEPTALDKQTGYQDGAAPTAVAFNWIINNYHRWVKNLDERTTKIPIHEWTVSNAVDRLTDRDFTTLAEAIASPSVGDGHSIFVASEEAITAPITITKRVRIVFGKNAYVYGDSGNSAVKIILNYPEIQIVGGSFFTFNNFVFQLNAVAIKCEFEGIYFGANVNTIDDSLVPEGGVPVIRGCHNHTF